MKNKKEKVFTVINLGWLGDTLLSSVLCQDIKLNYPDSKVIFIASKPFEEVAKGMHGVDEVFVYDKKQEHKGLLGPWKFAKKFPYKNKVYASFIVHAHERSLLLSLATGSKIRVCAPLKNSPLNLFITHKFNYTQEQIRNTYKANFNASYLSLLTGKPPQSKMGFSYPPEYDEYAKKILADFNPENAKIIGLCPLAKDEYRSLSVDFAAEFLTLCSQNSIKIMLVGTGKAGDFAKALREKTDIEFLDMTNKTTIFELSSLINNTDVFLSADTGPMHLSYSMGHKTVCLFFNKLMIEEWGPKNFANAVIMCNPDEKITPENALEKCSNIPV
ncbi:MAG: glycosyltransferase family 9 protein [Candidatus Gastranaerophilales bacterium]|nr:glycosyltransferase family 9 protein [Candidatus Gastranaerophilales bacterium]